MGNVDGGRTLLAKLGLQLEKTTLNLVFYIRRQFPLCADKLRLDPLLHRH